MASREYLTSQVIMHEIEPSSFCTIREYQRYFEKRIQASDIILGGLYLVLADIRDGRAIKQAFKFPIRTRVVDQLSDKHAVITADLLDLDLQPTQQTKFAMNDGIVSRPRICEKVTQQLVKEMYIKDYEDYLDVGPGEASASDEIIYRELVTA